MRITTTCDSYEDLGFSNSHRRRGGSPSAEDVEQGRKFFSAGSYGLAEKHFRRAVEANPKSVSAWVGLAASYDQLKRYDLAGKAYRRALALHGRQPLLLNNYGYHHLLKGNKEAARKILREAERKAPEDPAIQHNLALLENWSYADQFDGVPERPRKFDRR